jgi:hypothetical protein
MKKNLPYILILSSFCLLTTSFTSFENKTSLIFKTQIISKVKTICSYSFENVIDEMQIEKLKAEISLLKGVEEIKSVYKPEKKRGQITVIIFEPKRTSEGQVMFDITQIKKAIINQGLSPLEFTITEEFID